MRRIVGVRQLALDAHALAPPFGDPWLATLPDDGPTGGFFHDREAIPW